MSAPLTGIIIDDEPLAVKRLRRLMENHAGDVVIVEVAGNGEEGLHIIERLRPDVIFLDIEMPVMNGFEMLKRLTYMPRIIFTTAFEEYAIRAFEENSIDYLLKPVEPDRLAKAIDKLKRLFDTSPLLSTARIDALVNALNAKKEVKALPVR